jgi:hypothetical protein
MDTPESLDEFFGGLEALITDKDVLGGKAVTIILDDSAGQYNTVTSWFGMRGSEVLALLEYAKMGVMADMAGEIDMPDMKELN